MAEHCTDNASDRATGAYWEREFGIMAAKNGKVFSFMQSAEINRRNSTASLEVIGSITFPILRYGQAPENITKSSIRLQRRAVGLALRYTALLPLWSSLG